LIKTSQSLPSRCTYAHKKLRIFFRFICARLLLFIASSLRRTLVLQCRNKSLKPWAWSYYLLLSAFSCALLWKYKCATQRCLILRCSLAYRYSCLEYYNFEEGVTFFTLRLVGFHGHAFNFSCDLSLKKIV